MNSRPNLQPLSSLAGVVQPLWFLGLSFLLGLTRPDYVPLRDAISELGEAGASTALVWNVAGFFLSGVLYGLYAIAVLAVFGRGALFVLVVLQAVLLAGSAVFYCDPGCPPIPETTRMLGHTIAGLSYFAIVTILPLVAWRVFRGRPAWASLARPSLVVGLVLVVLFFVGPLLGQDRIGIWQRTDLAIAFAWQIAVALRIRAQLRIQAQLRSTLPASDPSPGSTASAAGPQPQGSATP